MDLIFRAIKEHLFFLISMVQGFLTGMTAAQILERMGFLSFGTPMKNLIAYCVVIFLIMLIYALYAVLFDVLGKKIRLYIGLALLIFALAADAYYIPV